LTKALTQNRKKHNYAGSYFTSETLLSEIGKISFKYRKKIN